MADRAARLGAKPERERAQQAVEEVLDREGEGAVEAEEKAEEIVEQVVRSAGGSPSVGRAVRDFFSTDEIYQRVLATAEEETGRAAKLLFVSGLTAGLSIGISFLARATLTYHAGGDEGSGHLIGSMLYPLGFLFIVMGRYALFTENTLTPVTLVLSRFTKMRALWRIWGIVLAANLIGASIIAVLLSEAGVLPEEVDRTALEIASHGLEVGWWPLFWRGTVAGSIVATMVWLTHAARDSVTRFLTVFACMYLIPVAGLFHCIIGACEALFLVLHGEAGAAIAWTFFAPVLLGNTFGGVVLVALLMFAQTGETRLPHWREIDEPAP